MRDQVVAAVAEAVTRPDCLVALGGGADSAVLAWAAIEALGAEKVRFVFVHHGLEGSDALCEAAIALTGLLGTSCEVIDRHVRDGGNLEARARAERYDAIEGVLPLGTSALTGHTADDQAETVLMRVLRGSGTGSASGIPYRRGPWRRPFLGFERKGLRSLAQELNLPFVDDPANTDPRFMRTRIRHEVLPLIEAECGPNVKAQLLRSSKLFAADDELLEVEAGNVQILRVGGGVSIPVGPLRSLPEPVASRVVRRALRMALDGYPGSARDVDSVLRVVNGDTPVTISGSHQVVHEPPFVTIARLQPPSEFDGFEVRVGEAFTWYGSDFTTRLDRSPPPAMAGGRFTLLDPQVIGDGFGVRGVEQGDRIDMGRGSTPITELLRAAGVPARVRLHSLIVTVGGKIAALVGVRVASWAGVPSGQAAVIIEREEGTWR